MIFKFEIRLVLVACALLGVHTRERKLYIQTRNSCMVLSAQSADSQLACAGTCLVQELLPLLVSVIRSTNSCLKEHHFLLGYEVILGRQVFGSVGRECTYVDFSFILMKAQQSESRYQFQ